MTFQKRILMLLIALALLTALPASADTWEPRVSPIKPPEGLGAGRPLAGDGIPGSYVPGASLVLTKRGLECVSPLDPQITMEYALERDEDESWADLYEKYEDAAVSSMITDGGDRICLLGGMDAWGGWDECAITFWREGEEEWMPLGVPEEDSIWGKDPPGFGPMLRMADSGRLLFADSLGMLHTCEMNGEDVQEIEGVAASDFVYHDGVIYFASLDDVKTYADVSYTGMVDDEPGEPFDLQYGRLYRVNLDGTGLERLTECGVRGLVAQGPHIVYQNLDEAFIGGFSEYSWPRVLYGTLYGFDADVGEHRPLGIESDKYFATPYGLAVWYHDMSFEPYDIERAELVLHAYDGEPLYRLDAGPAELLGSFGLGDGVVVFCSVEDWWTGDLAFTAVPLDGGAKWEWAPSGEAEGNTDQETVSFGEGAYQLKVPLDAEELDLMEYGLDDEAIKPLAKLTALRRLDLSMNDITDLSPLSGLENLEWLDLWDNSVVDLSPLCGLPRLETLVLLQNFEITDFTPLASLPALRSLNVSEIPLQDATPFASLTELCGLGIAECDISDLTPLAGLTKLAELFVSANEAVTDISPLAGMSELCFLWMDETSVSDLSPLSGLTALTELNLAHIPAGDLSPLAGLTALQILNLDQTSVEDLSPLSGLTNLQDLSLSGCQFSDPSPLFSLTGLERLNVSHNEALTREAVDLLKEKLSNTTIRSDYDEK